MYMPERYKYGASAAKTPQVAIYVNVCDVCLVCHVTKDTYNSNSISLRISWKHTRVVATVIRYDARMCVEL